MYGTGRHVVTWGFSVCVAACSLLTTSLVQRAVLQRTPGWAELCGLLALLCLTCRYARPSLVMACSVPLFVTAMRTQERAPVVSDLPVFTDTDGLFVLLPMAFGAGRLWGEGPRDGTEAVQQHRADRPERLVSMQRVVGLLRTSETAPAQGPR